MSETAFQIKTEQFEGPLDLLLSLIEKRKLFINDISLAKVADDFINFTNSQPSLPMGESADFILVASTLLLIKSKSLLPNLALTEEEKGSIDDLELRLKIYQRIKDASKNIKDNFGREIVFQPQARKQEPFFSPDSSMTLPNLLQAIKNVIQALPKTEKLPQAIVRKVISLEDMIGELTKRVQTCLKMSFKEFSASKTDRINVVVSFLAMLELVKQGVIQVTQQKHFDDIEIESQKVGVPHYNW